MATLATLPPDAQVMYQNMLQSNSLHMKDEPATMHSTRDTATDNRAPTYYIEVGMRSGNESEEEDMVPVTPPRDFPPQLHENGTSRMSLLSSADRSVPSHSFSRNAPRAARDNAPRAALRAVRTKDMYMRNQYIEDSEDEDGNVLGYRAVDFDSEEEVRNAYRDSEYVNTRDEVYSDDDMYDIVVPRE